jgi:hypothetical protein
VLLLGRAAGTATGCWTGQPVLLDIPGAVLLRGRLVVFARAGTHDDGVTSTPLPVQPEPADVRPVVGASGLERGPDLEEFWPSRREHAFDEFCR